MSSGTEARSEAIFLENVDSETGASVLIKAQSRASAAVHDAHGRIALAADLAASRLMTGVGRIVFTGAGASIRLAVQDMAELWPTYGWPQHRVSAVIAGGPDALTQSIEGGEDDADAGRLQVERLELTSSDVVIAVAASGRSPFTVATLSSRGDALGISLSNNAPAPLNDVADISVIMNTGSEVIAGSTRMVAGTAQKIALNTLTTLIMVRLNRTYQNLMVDMAAVNAKLDERRVRMLREIHPKISDQEAASLLMRANGHVKLAAVLAMGVSEDDALQKLKRADGSLQRVLGP